MSINCFTGIESPQTITDECSGNRISTDCVQSPNANIILDLPSGSTQTQINAAITTALIYKEEQIQAVEDSITTIDGSETIVTAGDNVTVTGTGTTLSPYVVNATSTDSRPYKIYSAILTQEFQNAPVATVLENTLGNITWTRLFPGLYEGTISPSGAFTVNKTTVMIQPGGDGGNIAVINFSLSNFGSSAGSELTLVTYMDGVINDEAMLWQTPIEIKVYQ